MVKPFPCIFDVALHLSVRGTRSLAATEIVQQQQQQVLPVQILLLACSQLDLFALVFLPA